MKRWVGLGVRADNLINIGQGAGGGECLVAQPLGDASPRASGPQRSQNVDQKCFERSA